MKSRLSSHKPFWILFIIYINTVFGGGILGIVMPVKMAPVIKEEKPTCRVVQKRQTEYQFINPLLTCEIFSSGGFRQLEPLKQDIHNLVAPLGKPSSKTSVYFHDFKTGQWIIYNGEILYAPSDLLRLPIVLSYYSLAEEHPEILRKLLIDENKNKQTVETLIEVMMNSSNESVATLLLENIDRKSLNEVYTDVAFANPPMYGDQPSAYLTVKSYGYFFRVLYNASFLNRMYSEKVLQMMLKTDKNVGIRLSIPDYIPVAHVYGSNERKVLDSQTAHTIEVRDCGIVYFPNNPYLLCIMGKGVDISQLNKLLQDISKIVLDRISLFYK